MNNVMIRNRNRTGRRAIAAAVGCLVLLSLFVCGCARQRQWTGKGITQAGFDQDAARCRREAAKVTYRDPFAYAAAQEQGLEHSVAQEKFFERCMVAKGYQLEDRSTDR
jgi:hypothetical protein